MSFRCVACSTLRDGGAEPSVSRDFAFAHCQSCRTRTLHRRAETPATPTDTQPVARRTDPETSWQAAKSVTRIRATQQHILDLLRVEPLTDEQIAARLERDGHGVSPSGARTRRAELVDMGLVRDSGARQTLSTGRRAIVWAATGVQRNAA